MTPLCTVSNSASISGLSKDHHIIVSTELSHHIGTKFGYNYVMISEPSSKRSAQRCQYKIGLDFCLNLVRILSQFMDLITAHHCWEQIVSSMHCQYKIGFLVKDVSTNSFCTISSSYIFSNSTSMTLLIYFPPGQLYFWNYKNLQY